MRYSDGYPRVLLFMALYGWMDLFRAEDTIGQAVIYANASQQPQPASNIAPTSFNNSLPNDVVVIDLMKTPAPTTSTTIIMAPESRACQLCMNNGMCDKSKTNQVTCVCPLDFEGVNCEKAHYSTLMACLPDTCNNGGNCTMMVFRISCMCSLNYVGVRCDRLSYIYTTHIDLKINWEREVVFNLYWWKKEITHIISTSICQQIRKWAISGSSAYIAASWAGCEIANSERDVQKISIENSNGSQTVLPTNTVELYLLFDFGENYTKAGPDNIFNQLNVGRLTVGNNFTNILGIMSIELNSVSVVNYCNDGLNDCSKFAICKPFGTTYICECKFMYKDSELFQGRLTGRMCIFSYRAGFILILLIMAPFIAFAVGIYCFNKRLRKFKRMQFRNDPNSDDVELLSAPIQSYN